MTTSSEYLEAAKLDEIARRYETEGYDVERDVDGSGVCYDLVARKGDRSVVVEVKASVHLRQSAQEIETLRQRAHAEGYDEFRLVVANAPREKTFEIEGLDRKLHEYLRDTARNIPELDRVGGRYFVEEIADLEIQSAEVASLGVTATGTGALAVRLDSPNGAEHDRVEWRESLPIDFAVHLGPDLRIERVGALRVDTSDLRDS